MTLTIIQPTNKLKIRILSETSILYLIRHASVILNVGLHSKDVFANKRTLFEEIYLHTMGSNKQPLEYSPNTFPTELYREICKVGFTLLLYSAIYSYNITPHCITTRKTSCIKQVSYYFFLSKQKNIAVDEIGRIVCPHLLARPHTYNLYKIVMHDWRSEV